VCEATCGDAPLFRYSAERSAAHFCPAARDRERNRHLAESISALWGGRECTVVRCAGCGFGFSDPHVAGDEHFYELLHEQQGYTKWRWDYDVAIAEAVRPRSGGRVLDIGAGTGAFLSSLGPEWDKFATEGSETTRSILAQKWIRVYRDLGTLAGELHGGFDVITMFQVLEHIAEFRPLLRLCRDLLKPGGQVVITVPDGDAMIAQERITGCPDMPPFHVNKWTPNSLARALASAGLQPGTHGAEPASWRNLAGAAHLRIIADASAPRSITAQVYGLSRRYRRPVLVLLAGIAVLRLLPHFASITRGGTFAMAAIRAS
jgi:SAM-dependent methyltransferase